ncbi:hypothetical protein [Leptospira levettii]|uniref:hypothetical protein n=1 Tax=Leptospira levettii TaxID=2023178 RepID=UPI00223E1B19|nr:hypothetical protein [Leptospira levettii]MCW7475538.1 hypothetical protein [Leptospira levettii]
MAAGQPKRLSEKILESFIFSLSPVKKTAAELEVYRLRREVTKILDSGKYTSEDVLALAVLEFNLGNYSESLKLMSNLSSKSLRYLQILTVAKLTLVHSSVFIEESENSVIGQYFNSKLNKMNEPLNYIVYLHSIFGIRTRYSLKSELPFNIYYKSENELSWTCGPFENDEQIVLYEEPNKARQLHVLLENNIQNKIINQEFTDKHRNFLQNFLDAEEVEHLIQEFTPREIDRNKDYSQYIAVSL